MKRKIFFLTLCATSLVFVNTIAHDNHKTQQSASDLSPFMQGVVEEVYGVHEKLSGLANEIPDDKYDWRPAEGVKSVSEVFIHASSANYFILSFFGNPMPEGFTRELESQVTEKEEVLKWLDKSFKGAAEFVATIDEGTLEEKVETPFGEITKRKLLFIMFTHGHEHLGQMIAYARSNGVVPPWSQKQDDEG
jgi:uncharacterized damage-inducible protein DinB